MNRCGEGNPIKCLLHALKVGDVEEARKSLSLVEELYEMHKYNLELQSRVEIESIISLARLSLDTSERINPSNPSEALPTVFQAYRVLGSVHILKENVYQFLVTGNFLLSKADDYTSLLERRLSNLGRNKKWELSDDIVRLADTQDFVQRFVESLSLSKKLAEDLYAQAQEFVEKMKEWGISDNEEGIRYMATTNSLPLDLKVINSLQTSSSQPEGVDEEIFKYSAIFYKGAEELIWISKKLREHIRGLLEGLYKFERNIYGSEVNLPFSEELKNSVRGLEKKVTEFDYSLFDVLSGGWRVIEHIKRLYNNKIEELILAKLVGSLCSSIDEIIEDMERKYSKALKQPEDKD